MTRPTSSPPPVLSTLRFDVEGLRCAACVGRVEEAIRSAGDVDWRDVVVSLPTHRARVVVALDASVALDAAATDAALAAARTSLERSVRAAGYALVDPTRGGGRAARDAAERRGLSRRALAAAVASAPLLVSGMSSVELPLAPWSEAALAVFVVVGCGFELLLRGVRAALKRAPDMHTLVALGATTALVASFVGLVRPDLATPHEAHGGAPRWFESAAVVTTFVLLGRVLEARARGRTTDALLGLATLAPKIARRVRDGREEEVPAESLIVGDFAIVRPGERVPTDGVVVEGRSSVDASLVTGESAARPVGVGDAVVGGTVNLDGAFTMRATAVGAATRLSAILRSVEDAATTKAPISRAADRTAAIFVPATLVFATLVGLFWAIFGPEPSFAYAFATTTAVLVVACPCALGLATPAALAVGVGRGAARGIFVRDAAALEALSNVDVLVCDKTGTLTKGAPEVSAVELATGVDRARIFDALATAEANATHPVGRALARYARREGGVARETTDFEQIPGEGARCVAGGETIEVGRGAKGRVRVRIGGVEAASLTLHDPPRKEAAEFVRGLSERGIRIVLATGDASPVARAAAASVGIDDVRADLSPEDKRAIVRALKAEGATVAVLGDGVNDAPALAEAACGVSFGGADVAADAAAIALPGGDLRQVLSAVDLARRTLRTIRANLVFAFAYNVLALPAAAGALYPFTGALFDPMWAGAAMALSSVTVTLNSLRLR